MDHVVWDRRFGDLVDTSILRQAGDGLGFPEGPVMLPDGYLVFSDIANDAIVGFSRPGRTGIFRQPSGGANGTTLDPRGRLVTCQAGRRRVTRTEPDGASTVLAAQYEGKRLNAPNDVAARSVRREYPMSVPTPTTGPPPGGTAPRFGAVHRSRSRRGVRSPRQSVGPAIDGDRWRLLDPGPPPKGVRDSGVRARLPWQTPRGPRGRT